MTEKELILVSLRYPGLKNSPDTIDIELEDVRASDGIRVKYDFERDGWVIMQQRITSPDHCEKCCDAYDSDAPYVEVSFVRSWSQEFCAGEQENG